MPNQANFPTSHAQFVRKAKLGIRRTKVRLNLTRFVYRYRLAESFEGLIAPDLGRTLLGYDVITKIFLTNTAYELIVKTSLMLNIPSVSDLNTNAVINEDVAIKIRNNTVLKKFLLAYPDHHQEVKEKLQLFFSEGTSDVVCVAYAIRNIFAHGDLTATAIGTETKKKRDALLDLADAILDYCDQLFTKCVAKI
jgi:hypothetical protein